MKINCVEVNANINDHEEVIFRLVELMDAGGNLSDRDNYEEIFFGERYRIYRDSFKDESIGATILRFVEGVVIVATSCGGVKSPGISAVTIP